MKNLLYEYKFKSGKTISVLEDDGEIHIESSYPPYNRLSTQVEIVFYEDDNKGNLIPKMENK